MNDGPGFALVGRKGSLATPAVVDGGTGDGHVVTLASLPLDDGLTGWGTKNLLVSFAGKITATG